MKAQLFGAALLVSTLTACSAGTTTIVPTVDSAEVESAEVEASSPTQSKEAEDQSAPEPGNLAASADLGSRDNPLPIGTAVILDDGMGGVWEVTLLSPDLEANEIVLAENMFNEDPPEGLQYAVLPVVAKYLGDETGTAAWDLDFAFVSAAGTTHKSFDVTAVGPDELANVNELYKEGIAEGNVIIAIPSADAELGTWRIGTSWGDTAAFFAAQ